MIICLTPPAIASSRPWPIFFSGYRYHVTGLTHDVTGFPTENPEISQALIERLEAKISDNLAHILKYEESELADAEIAVLAYGSVARSAQVAIAQARADGIKAGLFRPVTLWPFPKAQGGCFGPTRARDFGAGDEYGANGG